MTRPDFEQIQQLLSNAQLDGWLIYDFQSLNPLALSVLHIPAEAHLTRRFFVWVPAQGEVKVLHNSIEGGTWKTLSHDWNVTLHAYRGHADLQPLLESLLKPGMKVAMEYSPMGSVPYVGRVDAGTIERVKALGVDVVSSADLLQHFFKWSSEDLEAHQRAVEVLMEAKDAAFEFIRSKVKLGQSVDELSVQAVISETLRRGGLHFDHPAIVGFAGHAGDPHYAPNPEGNRTLQKGDCILLDLWGQEPGRPYADVTWMGFYGEPSENFLKAWEAVKGGRDIALEQIRAGKQGWELDFAARKVIVDAGYGEAFTHRLGHSLGVQLHGPTANLDDLETRDTRTLLPHLAVTIEPGIYLPEQDFGIRSEVNVVLLEDQALVTTPVQQDLIFI
ncbi:M24 family metallopeptidase [Deinococcus misasensis]|uniref:M24 family metallopeptidase n=1 Tax=Deinococcus misasensis TaxID=392413 RepID=UPI0006894753|nr:Xaa-Pro peptidase family protein [Deinococcus misasensis]